VRAKVWYCIAGGSGFSQGQYGKVVKCFSRYEKLSGRYLILKNPEKAVAKAREYYEKFFKS